jgi:uncharacterized protein YcbK (DUF882 family)
MKRFKSEYQDARVTINSPSIGKVVINTATADASQWANLPEFAFMTEDSDEVFEDVKGYEDYTLSELREMFPDIKATSKKSFIEQING